MRKLFWLMMSMDGITDGPHREIDRRLAHHEFAAYVAEIRGSIDTIALRRATGGANAGTINTASLEELNGRTTMTINARYRSREDREAGLGSGVERGSAEGFDRLAALVEAPA